MSFNDAIKQNIMYIEGELYEKHLACFVKYLGGQQFLTLLFNYNVSSPEQVIVEVLRFLDLDSKLGINIRKVSRNQSKKSGFPCAKLVMTDLPNFLIDLNLGMLLHLTRKVGLSLYFRLTTSPFKCPDTKPVTRKNLTSVVQGDITQLGQFLDCDISHRV